MRVRVPSLRRTPRVRKSVKKRTEIHPSYLEYGDVIFLEGEECSHKITVSSASRCDDSGWVIFSTMMDCYYTDCHEGIILLEDIYGRKFT